MPWRAMPTPYHVLVSELMLQQTQVPRVIPKFETFVRHFPAINDLAEAPLSAVLAQWSGLGYNRRAKYLWESAKMIKHDFDGQLPNNFTQLQKLPGVGPNTAGAIMVYAFNKPAVFIETNIRSVILHHFFATTSAKIDDLAIAEILRQVLPDTNFKDWYWGLMDYGTYLKATAGGQLHKVRHYRKQTKFIGSRRQVRGQVMRLLLKGSHATNQIEQLITDERLPEVLIALHKEGLISKTKGTWHLTGQPG